MMSDEIPADWGTALTEQERQRKWKEWGHSEKLMVQICNLLDEYLELECRDDLVFTPLADYFTFALDDYGWMIVRKPGEDKSQRWFLQEPLDNPEELPAWCDNEPPEYPPNTVFYIDPVTKRLCHRVRQTADILELIPGGKKDEP